MQWDHAAVSDRGRTRTGNEDAYALAPEIGVFVLADGMGGHAGGEVASALAVDTFRARLAAVGREDGQGSDDELRAAFVAAHQAIVDRARNELLLDGMGTTLTALVLDDSTPSYRIAHVGDSRAYLLRDGELRQLTTDHTWVQAQVELGRVAPEDAARHPRANILTRAIGGWDEPPKVDILTGEIRAGDLFILCSDGLHGTVEYDEMRELLLNDEPLETIAQRLVDAANRRGGPDNITVVLVEVGRGEDRT